MTRTSNNLHVIETGRLIHGYDYENQAWVKDGVYVACGHPDSWNCLCYGKINAGNQCEVKNQL